MSDLGSELKNAALSSTAKTVKVVICGDQCSFTRDAARKWFGKIEECNEGTEDIFLFRSDTFRLDARLRQEALASLARGSHVFQYDHIGKNFIRRDGFWFDKR